MIKTVFWIMFAWGIFHYFSAKKNYWKLLNRTFFKHIKTLFRLWIDLDFFFLFLQDMKTKTICSKHRIWIYYRPLWLTYERKNLPTHENKIRYEMKFLFYYMPHFLLHTYYLICNAKCDGIIFEATRLFTKQKIEMIHI